MSSRFPARETMPARLTWSYIRGLHDSVPNGNPAIYWVDSGLIMRLKGKKSS